MVRVVSSHSNVVGKEQYEIFTGSVGDGDGDDDYVDKSNILEIQKKLQSVILNLMVQLYHFKICLIKGIWS